MFSKTAITAALSVLSTAFAAQQGFNYASTNPAGGAMFKSDYQTLFQNAQNLAGTNGGFTDARLYTMIQYGTTSDLTQAIDAALAVPGTKLLLGMWASGGDAAFANELIALNNAMSTYGSKLANIVNGIAVGSEDLYRESPTGIINQSGVGAGPDTITSYISKVKSALQGNSAFSGVKVGHVDTWTAWVNGSVSSVVQACDFIGMDAYPYFQNTFNNPIDQGKSLFQQAYQATIGAAAGKPVWITETGWPVSGKTENLAIPSTSNAQTYWQQVGCPLFGNTPIYWYTLEDAGSVTPNPSFGVITAQSTTPLYNLACNGTSNSTSTSSASATGTATGSLSTGTGSGFSSINGTSGTGSGSGSSGSGSGSSGSGSGSSGSGSGSGSGAGGNVGPTPTTTAKSGSFTGAGVVNRVSGVLGSVAVVAVGAFLL